MAEFFLRLFIFIFFAIMVKTMQIKQNKKSRNTPKNGELDVKSRKFVLLISREGLVS